MRVAFFISVCFLWFTQMALYSQNIFIDKDSLRGSNTQYRDWWDVKHYDLIIEPDFDKHFIKGVNTITFDNKKTAVMQIDLQYPMKIDSIWTEDSRFIPFTKKDNFYFIEIKDYYSDNTKGNKLVLFFSGTPIVAKNAPWDGGWVFTKDKKNTAWMSVACEGIGASVWFPCKDYLGDKPEEGAQLTIITHENLIGVGNGKLERVEKNKEASIYKWKVENPINNYNIIPYIGDYVNFTDVYEGEKGILSLSYWVLSYNIDKAKKQFVEVKDMLRAFEYWFGPYPFYEDGYKLVEAPYLGMEHQSAIAYGNEYKNGYLGYDRSGTGIGLNWDFIIVHESGHEWFGNSVTNKEVADMWVHEAFATYSETLFVEYYYGKEAANKYIIGQRRNIINDRPIIGEYGVNRRGSTDMYDKGANMIHTIRQIINDDEKFRNILRGINKEFYHQTVTSEQIENYISEKAGIDFSKVFNQYLRTTKIPILEYYFTNNRLFYRWINVIPNFTMKLKTSIGEIIPTGQWQSVRYPKKRSREYFAVDESYYIIMLAK